MDCPQFNFYCKSHNMYPWEGTHHIAYRQIKKLRKRRKENYSQRWNSKVNFPVVHFFGACKIFLPHTCKDGLQVVSLHLKTIWGVNSFSSSQDRVGPSSNQDRMWAGLRPIR